MVACHSFSITISLCLQIETIDIYWDGHICPSPGPTWLVCIIYRVCNIINLQININLINILKMRAWISIQLKDTQWKQIFVVYLVWINNENKFLSYHKEKKSNYILPKIERELDFEENGNSASFNANSNLEMGYFDLCKK